MARARSVVALSLFLALVGIAALTATSGATITDPNAQPQAWWIIDHAGGDDRPFDVAVNSAGAAYVCGQVRNDAGSLDGSLYKFPMSGVGWRKTWDGPARANDGFYAVAVAPDGRVYTAGANRNTAGQLDMRLVKWSPAGDVLWTRRYTGPVAGDDIAHDVVVDGNGNVTVCGESQGRNGLAFTVVSWTGGGTLRWVRRINGVDLSYARANAMVVDGAGNLYVTGKRGWYAGIMAGHTVKLSPAGVTRWSHTYTNTDNAEFTAIARRPGGGVFVCGYQIGFDTGDDGVLIRYKAGGDRLVLRVETMDGSDGNDTIFNSVAATPSGLVGVAGGVSYNYGATHARYFRVFNGDTGTLVSSYLSSASPDAQTMVATAADAFGGLYATGTAVLSGSHTTIRTQRYTTILNAGTWTGTVGSVDVGLHRPAAIATWKTTVWVVGRYYSAGTGSDQVVIRYIY